MGKGFKETDKDRLATLERPIALEHSYNEPDRTAPGADNTVRKAHYGAGRQPIDDIFAVGWGPHFAAANVLKYLRRDKDRAASVDKARWYYSWMIQHAASEVNGPFTKAIEDLEELLTKHERLMVRDIKERKPCSGFKAPIAINNGSCRECGRQEEDHV